MAFHLIWLFLANTLTSEENSLSREQWCRSVNGVLPPTRFYGKKLKNSASEIHKAVFSLEQIFCIAAGLLSSPMIRTELGMHDVHFKSHKYFYELWWNSARFEKIWFSMNTRRREEHSRQRRENGLVTVYDLNQQVVLDARVAREQSNANVNGKADFHQVEPKSPSLKLERLRRKVPECVKTPWKTFFCP